MLDKQKAEVGEAALQRLEFEQELMELTAEKAAFEMTISELERKCDELPLQIDELKATKTALEHRNVALKDELDILDSHRENLGEALQQAELKVTVLRDELAAVEAAKLDSEQQVAALYEALDVAEKARAGQAIELTQAEILQIETAGKLHETEVKMSEAAAESKFLVEELSSQLEKKAMEAALIFQASGGVMDVHEYKSPIQSRSSDTTNPPDRVLSDVPPAQPKGSAARGNSPGATEQEHSGLFSVSQRFPRPLAADSAAPSPEEGGRTAQAIIDVGMDELPSLKASAVIKSPDVILPAGLADLSLTEISRKQATARKFVPEALQRNASELAVTEAPQPQLQPRAQLQPQRSSDSIDLEAESRDKKKLRLKDLANKTTVVTNKSNTKFLGLF